MALVAHDTPVLDRSGGRVASGLGLALLSATSFGLSGSLARGLMEAGWSSAAAVAVRILLAAAVLVPVAAIQLRGRWSLLRGNLPLITAYGLIAVAGTQLAFFNAVAQCRSASPC
jgi:drug/metabolite transporter (DMT)-like permease